MAIIIWFRLLYLSLVDTVLYLKQADIQTIAGGNQILEEQLVNVNETMAMDMADLLARGTKIAGELATLIQTNADNTLANADDIQILEEQLVNVNETMVMDMADLEVNISSNSADLKMNDLHIFDIQVSTCNGYYYNDYLPVSAFSL